jgi:arginine utilization regulatory protein
MFDFIMDKIKIGIIVLNEKNEPIFLNAYAKIISADMGIDSLINHIKKKNNKTLALEPLHFHIEHIVQDNYLIYILYDITNEIMHHRKNICYEQALDNVDNGVIITDNNGIINLYNRAVQNFENLNKEDAMNKIVEVVYKTEGSRIRHVIERKIALLEQYETYETFKGDKIICLQNYLPVFDNKELLGVVVISNKLSRIDNISEAILKQQKIYKDRNKTFAREGFDVIIGKSDSLLKAVEEAKKLSKNDINALLIGETGTGKELFVKSIHNESSRKDKPFIPVNCAAIPDTLAESLLFGVVKGSFTGSENTKGFFELAKDGTIFLDELNSMDINLQSKLLRVIEDRKIRRIGGEKEYDINCRIIGAINQDPMQCINEGTLRRDLFYRLAIVSVHIPPLRERKQDIEPLVNYFIDFFNHKYHHNVKAISDELMKKFMEYTWKGNIREIKNIIEGTYAMVNNEEIIDCRHLPSYVSKLFDIHGININKNQQYNKIMPLLLYDYEKKLIIDVLETTHGNKSKAANILGITRQSLNYKIKKFNL